MVSEVPAMRTYCSMTHRHDGGIAINNIQRMHVFTKIHDSIMIKISFNHCCSYMRIP